MVDVRLNGGDDRSEHPQQSQQLENVKAMRRVLDKDQRGSGEKWTAQGHHVADQTRLACNR